MRVKFVQVFKQVENDSKKLVNVHPTTQSPLVFCLIDLHSLDQGSQLVSLTTSKFVSFGEECTNVL